MRTTRRRLTTLLHWLNLALLVSLAAGAEGKAWLWLFATTGLMMAALALGFGLQSRPGVKLEGALRRVHPWMHWSLYAALAAVSALTGWAAMGGDVARDTLQTAWLGLIGATSLHGIFHLWRHTALGDGALRSMTPRFMHGIL